MRTCNVAEKSHARQTTERLFYSELKNYFFKEIPRKSTSDLTCTLSISMLVSNATVASTSQNAGVAASATTAPSGERSCTRSSVSSRISATQILNLRRKTVQIYYFVTITNKPMAIYKNDITHGKEVGWNVSLFIYVACHKFWTQIDSVLFITESRVLITPNHWPMHWTQVHKKFLTLGKRPTVEYKICFPVKIRVFSGRGLTCKGKKPSIHWRFSTNHNIFVYVEYIVLLVFFICLLPR